MRPTIAVTPTEEGVIVTDRTFLKSVISTKPTNSAIPFH
ncbi:unnamed protein product [Acidithrix sp. C25]|nr:unnamed protein product [Acidithrix sp. C25]